MSQLELNYIRQQTDGGLRIGALTPLSALLDSPLILAYAQGLLSDAARVVAPSGLREIATVGGAWQSPAGPPEVRLALDALRAEAVWEHAIPLEIKLPAPAPGSAGALERLTRAPRDEAIVAVVAVTYGMSSARLCVGPAPYYSVQVESLEVEPALDGWQPISDFRASAEYRKAMAGVLARRALATAFRLHHSNR